MLRPRMCFSLSLVKEGQPVTMPRRAPNISILGTLKVGAVSAGSVHGSDALHSKRSGSASPHNATLQPFPTDWYTMQGPWQERSYWFMCLLSNTSLHTVDL